MNNNKKGNGRESERESDREREIMRLRDACQSTQGTRESMQATQARERAHARERARAPARERARECLCVRARERARARARERTRGSSILSTVQNSSQCRSMACSTLDSVACPSVLIVSMRETKRERERARAQERQGQSARARARERERERERESIIQRSQLKHPSLALPRCMHVYVFV